MKQITVTTPLIPSLNELTPYLEDIWQRKWLTNNGHYHQLLEKELCNYLGVKHVSLFSNATLALIAAMQALELEGEVITTPYSFVATSHSIMLNNLTPVFVDVEPDTFNLDPNKIRAAITDKTCAILPVHVYGNPCNHEEIQAIAERYNLKVIYDAAHAFGVKKDGCSILNWGDLSILSFHATKVYSTIEGGAIICHTLEMKQKLDRLKNFGYESETQIAMLGSNAKMNEIQAAFGLANLKLIDHSINKRQQIAKIYRETFSGINGIRCLDDIDGVRHNYSYFPIIIDAKEYGLERFEIYRDNRKTVQHDNVVAKNISDNVICLPMHHELSLNDVMFISNLIR